MATIKKHFRSDNKGNFNPAIVTGFAVLLLTVILGATIMSNLTTVASSASITQINDQQITGASTPTAIGNINIRSTEFYAENITNATNSVAGPGNFTLNAAAGTLNFSASSGFQGQLVNLTYNYTDQVRNGAYNASYAGQTGVLQFSSMSGALGITLVATIVIGVLGTVILLLRR